MVLNVASAVGAARGLVVVTGADGFVGRAACAHFRAAGIPFRGLVRALSITTAARPDMLPVGDLTGIADDALANALNGADIVVHLAGRAHVMRERAADPLSAFRAINVAATERLARAAAAAGAAHLVFASSVKVNGEATPPERPFRESDPPDPRDAYAVSKCEAERVLGDVSRETGLPVTVLRLPLLYGPWVKGNVARLTGLIARGVPLPLASIDNRRSLLGVGNFMSALDSLVGHPPPAPGTVATYFLADAVPVATPELVRAIATALGVTARLVPIPSPLLHLACASVGRTAACDRLTGSLVVDTGAFREAFGWQPPRSLEEELADMVRARREVPAPPL
jgi:nucleoside-diphosphate-sugar epimerase